MESLNQITPPWRGWRIVGESPIGRGGFGSVWKIERLTGGQREVAAMKVISVPGGTEDVDSDYASGYSKEQVAKKYSACKDDVISEYSLMSKLQKCPNVVHCYEVKDVPHDGWPGFNVYIRMELLTSLYERLLSPGHFGPKETARLGIHICRALVECEGEGIIHRDIKPANIMVATPETSEASEIYKLGDFGVGRYMEHTTAATKVGTPDYMAPEVMRGAEYGKQADIYSLGLVLYWLLNGRRMPFVPMGNEVPSPSEESHARQKRMRGEPLPSPLNGSSELKWLA